MSDKRLIDANALVCKIAGEYFSPRNPSSVLTEVGMEIANAAIDRALILIHNAPTIYAVPVVHGRWDTPVEHGLPYASNHLGVVCSYCCKWSDNDYNYCPNCGAKMDAKEG